jgi:hypothetical protein
VDDQEEVEEVGDIVDNGLQSIFKIRVCQKRISSKESGSEHEGKIIQ